MIIKQPGEENIPALTALWMQVFGDSAEFIQGFFRTGFRKSRCLLAEEKGQLLSALYWFDCRWGSKKVAYLYAIATDENHRGKGICRQLMEHAHQTLKEQGYAGAILVPAHEGLFKMYAKIGYNDCPWPRTQNAKCKIQAEPISVTEYRNLQKSLLPANAVTHTDAAFSYLQTFATFYKTQAGILCKTEDKIQECLPGNPVESAMYLPLTEDKTLPTYFALSLG